MPITNQVRIISGIHRGRRLPFANIPGLRPTGDRMRETLFNWLQPVLPGASCLDVFAGSGALGLEAASRGANRVIMLDSAPQVVRQLQLNLNLLRLNQVEAIQANAISWLSNPPECFQRFDIVFLDPPFDTNLMQSACALLLQYGWLNAGALVYLERDAKVGVPLLADNFTLIRHQRMGRVWCGLARYE